MIDNSDQKLIQSALDMQKQAHAPYSNFHVGAAVKTECGKIFGGCNIESVSYGLTVCAERVAIFQAIAQGYKKVTKLVVATKNGASPCGACRQIIYEFCPDASIVIVDNNKNEIIQTTSKELLPYAFNDSDLKK